MIAIIVIILGIALFFATRARSKPNTNSPNDKKSFAQKASPATEFLPPIMQFFPRKHPLGPGRYELTVRGESLLNLDGTSRQEIIKNLSSGDRINLVREPLNQHDANAIRVDCSSGTIGYVAREEAVNLATICDQQRVVGCAVKYVGGGTGSKPSRGVWLCVEVGP